MTEQWQTGKPPAPESDLFVGREDEIAWTTEQLVRGQRLLAVYGMHRIGKTAFLHALVDRLPPSWFGVYLDLAAEGETAIAPIAAAFARQVEERIKLRLPVPDPASLDQAPVGSWQRLVDAAAAALGDRRLVLLCDNVAQVSPERLYVVSQARVPILLAAEHAQQIGDLLPASLFSAPSVTLGPLDNDAGTALVKALVSPTSPIDPWAVRRVLEITSNQPYYIHLFCQVLVACCVVRSPITPPHVETALRSILETPVSEFIVEWQRSNPRERVLLAVFASLRGHGGVATQYDLQKACSRFGQPPQWREILDTLEGLVDRDVLERLGTNSYRFRLELYRLWIDHHHPPEPLYHTATWRYGRSPVRRLGSTVGAALSRHRTLWLSVAAVVLVALIVAMQPAMWRSCSGPAAPTATRILVLPQHTPTPTRVIAATATPSQPSFVLPGYDLAIMSRAGEGDPWQIYALDSVTGERRRLTETRSNERTPKWSPDGTRIVFASDRDGDRDIYLMDLQAALEQGAAYQPVNLTQNEDPDWQPAWSPDGRRIAFSSYRDENWEIYLVNADGTDLVRVTENAESDISPTWSPDGSQILFVSRRRGDADLFLWDVETEQLAQLTTGEQDEYDPAWSPDGEWIAFVTQIGSQSDVFVMRADGSDRANLTQTSYANDFQPMWTLDGEWLIYTSYTAAEGDHDLYIMRRDGSDAAVLVDSDTHDIAPSLRRARP